MVEQDYCPFCGAEITIGDKFCNNCGAEIEEAQIEKTSTTQIVTQQLPEQQTTQKTTVIYKPKTQPQETDTLRLVLVIIGIIFGILSFTFLGFVFAWYVHVAWLAVIPATTILGIIFSAVSLRSHKILGAIGLILNSIGFLIELGFGIFVLIIWIAWTF
jgi:hypothetical protein